MIIYFTTPIFFIQAGFDARKKTSGNYSFGLIKNLIRLACAKGGLMCGFRIQIVFRITVRKSAELDFEVGACGGSDHLGQQIDLGKPEAG